MISIELRRLITRVGVIGSIALTNQAQASPVEHAVDTLDRIDPIGLRYGDHTVNSRLATALEVDRYTFAGQAGDQLRILVHTLTGGLDPSLVLRGPTGGAILGSTWCDGNDIFGRQILCSANLDMQLALAGTYTLNVSDLGADEAGSYQLHLESYPPANNWLGFQYTTPVAETLGHTTDFDFFAFNGVVHSGIRLTVANTTGGLDPVLEVWDPLGKRISNTVCDGNDIFGRAILCSNSVDLDLSLSGVYKVGISDSGWDETGGYRLAVNCLFGDCPAPSVPPPSPIPEPGIYALMLAGLALLAKRLPSHRQARD